MSPARAVLLLVDDERAILSALRRCLRREPVEIVSAESAGEALRTLESQRVDIVLTDQQMPGTNGLDLLRTVAERWPATRRMLITGWPGDLDAARLEAIGVRALIAKPWDAEELRAHVRACLGPGA